MTALSGVDQALWDIAGKYYDVPVYKLLGGPVRNRVRVYAHWGIPSLDDKAKTQAGKRLENLRKRGGYTASLDLCSHLLSPPVPVSFCLTRRTNLPRFGEKTKATTKIADRVRTIAAPEDTSV